MPALKNKRHEAFAQAHARGMSASDAYRVTYGTNSKNVDVLGSRLALLVNVGNRVIEIQKAAERITHLTIEEKRSIYAHEGTNPQNDLRDRLRCLRDDSEIAGHIKSSEQGALSVNVNVVSLSEDRRSQLLTKKQASIARRLQKRAGGAVNGSAGLLLNGSNGNGHHD